MRILITAGQYHPDHPSGSNRIAYEEARFLASLGHETWIIGQNTLSQPELDVDSGLSVLRYSIPQLSLLSPRRAWTHQASAKALLRNHLPQVDVVHGHSPLTYEAACSVYGTTTKVRYTVHSPAPLEMALVWADGTLSGRLRCVLGIQMIERLERRCLLRSMGITALSKFTANLISTLYGPSTAERLNIIPGWADLDRFQISSDRTALKSQLGWPVDVPVLFTLRRLVPRMGLDTLIRALQRVIQHGRCVQLLIGGDGPLRSYLEGLSKELDLAPYCSFLGHVPDEKLPAMYAACDAFVVPTAQLECFGLIILEALASGTPVLATPVGAIPEVLGPVEPRWLAEDQSEVSLARLLEAFLKGNLPSHAPEDLRASVSRRYARAHQLSRLASFLLS